MPEPTPSYVFLLLLSTLRQVSILGIYTTMLKAQQARDDFVIKNPMYKPFVNAVRSVSNAAPRLDYMDKP